MGVPTLIVNDTSRERHHGCTRVMRTLRTLCAAYDLDVIGAIPVHEKLRRQDMFAELLDPARLIIVNGEGSLHHGATAAEDLLSIAGVAKARGIPTVLLNASWQANPPHFIGLASAFALIAVRESLSQAELARQGVHATLTPDLSLYMPHRGAAAIPRAGVLFNDSVVPEVAAELTRRRLLLGAEEVSIFEPRRLSDVVWKARVAASRARTAPLVKRFAEFADNWSTGAPVTDDRALIQKIAAAQLLVTGRFHAACFALLAETPIICTQSNTHKIEGLLRDAGLNRWRLVDAKSIDERVIAEARTLHPHEQANVADYLASGRLAVRHLFGEMRALC